jgi:hypothetical protein
MISDGAGGAIIIWADFAKNIVAQRVNAGLPWGATPKLVSGDARDEGPLDAAPDGAGGALISWSAIRLLPANGQVRVQRIDSSGDAVWTVGGVVVVDSSIVGGSLDAWVFYSINTSVDTDADGGAIVAWTDWRNDPTASGNNDIYAQRIDSSGTTRWSGSGVLLPPFIVGSTAPGSQALPEVVADGVGGAIVTYQDKGGSSWDISATRVDAFGTKLFSNYVFTDFTGVDRDQTEPRIVFDGSGPAPRGAILAWDDDRSGLDVRAQKIQISGPANDASQDAQTVTPGGFSGTLLAASSDGGSSCGLGGDRDVWFVFTPSEPGRLEVDTCGSNDLGGVDTGMDTVLSLHTASPGTPENEVACNDDWTSAGSPPSQCAGVDGGGARDSATSFEASSIEPIWIRVSNYPGTPTNDFVLNVRFVPEPQALAMLMSGAGALLALARHRRVGRVR